MESERREFLINDMRGYGVVYRHESEMKQRKLAEGLQNVASPIFCERQVFGGE
jgi:hypothetical protein